MVKNEIKGLGIHFFESPYKDVSVWLRASIGTYILCNNAEISRGQQNLCHPEPSIRIKIQHVIVYDDHTMAAKCRLQLVYISPKIIIINLCLLTL